MSGRLFVCATPIGNLEDATLRLLRVLAEVDFVAAEDTRRTRKLLNRHEIKAKLVAYHEHNEHTQTQVLVDKLAGGANIALVSDGGMPAICDPGYKLISACIADNLRLEVIPGASSVLSALVLSGLPTARFCFEGFLPKKAGEQMRRLQALSADERTLIFFESPKRTLATLSALKKILGDRQVAVVRELTKIHEQVVRGPISRVVARLPQEILGEVVLVVAGALPASATLGEAVEFAAGLVTGGQPKSKAAADAASRFKHPRRDIYEALLRLA